MKFNNRLFPIMNPLILRGLCYGLAGSAIICLLPVPVLLSTIGKMVAFTTTVFLGLHDHARVDGKLHWYFSFLAAALIFNPFLSLSSISSIAWIVGSILGLVLAGAYYFLVVTK